MDLQSIHLQLPAEAMARVMAAVSAGDFHTPSEAVSTALMQWSYGKPLQLVNLDELSSLIKEGEESADAPDETLEEFLTAARLHHTSKH